MGMVDRQWKFLKDVAKLIEFIDQQPLITATAGELYRTDYQQAEHVRTGKSKTMKSKHLDRLAIDLNFFYNGTYMGASFDRDSQREILQEIGEYWCSLGEGYQWGGNWGWDFPHFQG